MTPAPPSPAARHIPPRRYKLGRLRATIGWSGVCFYVVHTHFSIGAYWSARPGGLTVYAGWL